jgi:hypothetical protein
MNIEQGLVNVLVEHHPTIGDIITNKYLKVMFKIPKTGHLPTPVECDLSNSKLEIYRKMILWEYVIGE